MAYSRIAAIGKCTPAVGTFDNPTVIQTIDNILMFTGELSGVTASAWTDIAELPNTISAPQKNVLFICTYLENSQYKQGVLYYNTQRKLRAVIPFNNATLYLNGICLNLNNNFYNNTIGNNDENIMTSPISYE